MTLTQFQKWFFILFALLSATFVAQAKDEPTELKAAPPTEDTVVVQIEFTVSDAAAFTAELRRGPLKEAEQAAEVGPEDRIRHYKIRRWQAVPMAQHNQTDFDHSLRAIAADLSRTIFVTPQKLESITLYAPQSRIEHASRVGEGLGREYGVPHKVQPLTKLREFLHNARPTETDRVHAVAIATLVAGLGIYGYSAAGMETQKMVMIVTAQTLVAYFVTLFREGIGMLYQGKTSRDAPRTIAVGWEVTLRFIQTFAVEAVWTVWQGAVGSRMSLKTFGGNLQTAANSFVGGFGQICGYPLQCNCIKTERGRAWSQFLNALLVTPFTYLAMQGKGPNAEFFDIKIPYVLFVGLGVNGIYNIALGLVPNIAGIMDKIGKVGEIVLKPLEVTEHLSVEVIKISGRGLRRSGKFVGNQCAYLASHIHVPAIPQRFRRGS